MPTKRRRRRQPVIPHAVQGTILFLVGLGLLIHEATLPASQVSWPRLVAFGGMMGLPFGAWADTAKRAAGALWQTEADDDEGP